MAMPAFPTRTSSPSAPTKASRMTLASVVSGVKRAPARVLIYGVPKVGKSTWAAGAPAPIWLGLDAGTEHLDVARFPEPESFEDVLEAIRTLEGEHPYKTLVVDPVNWIEPLIWKHLCSKNNWADIEAPGYGKGYTAAVDVWRTFVAALDRLRERGMHVVLVGHSTIKTLKNPEGDDYDRYQLPIHDKAAGLLTSWSDCILFAQHEIDAKKERGSSKVKAIGTGYRLLRTQPAAAYEAGNRFSLQDPLPLEPDLFWSVANGPRPEVVDLRKESLELAAMLGGDAVEKAQGAIAKMGEDVGRLTNLRNAIQKAIQKANEEEAS